MKKYFLKALSIHLLSIILLSLCIYPISYLFFNKNHVAFITSLIASIFNYKIIFDIYKYYKKHQAEQFFLQFMQLLNNQLSINSGLIYAIAHCLKLQLKSINNRDTKKRIKEILSSIELGIPLKKLIISLIDLYPCDSAKTSLSLMISPEVLGNKLSLLTRETLHKLIEDRNYQSQVRSSIMGNLIESIILNILPIIILLLLRFSSKDFMSVAYQSSLGKILLGISFFSLVFSIKLISLIFIPNRENYKIAKSNSLVRDKKYTIKDIRNNTKAKNFLEKIYPNTTLDKFNRIKLILIDQQLKSESNIYVQFLTHKIFIIISLIILNIIFIKFNLNLFILLFINLLMLIYPEYKLWDKANNVKKTIKIEIIDIYKSLVMFLSIGYSINRSLDYIINLSNLSKISLRELRMIQKKANNGISIIKILDQIMYKFDDYEINEISKLIQDYSSLGNSTSINNLKLYTQILDKSRMEKIKQKSAINKNNYLFPMLLSLISVLLISLSPILPRLQL